MKPTDKLIVPTQVMSRKIGDETVLLDLASGTYFGLDELGAKMWDRLSIGDSIEQTCVAIVAEYDVTNDVAVHDAIVLCEKLVSHGLATVDTVQA